MAPEPTEDLQINQMACLRIRGTCFVYCNLQCNYPTPLCLWPLAFVTSTEGTMSELNSSWLYPKAGTFMLNTVRNVLTQPFAFDLLLQHFAKERKKMLLVLLSQNWAHYSAVATKCGLNLKNCQTDGTVSTVDLFEYPAPLIHDFDYSFDWPQLVQEIDSKLAALPEHSSLLIDDLSVLLSLGIDSSRVYTFVRQLRRKLAKKRCTLFIASYYLPEDEQAHSLLTSLIYECDCWIDCDKPKSGYSLQINGIAMCLNKSNDTSIEMNYKFSNRNVIFKKL